MIVVCGEALIDMFVDAGEQLTVAAHAGGSPFNVAVGLARLGQRSCFFGGLAGDSFGRYLRQCLRHEQVDVRAAPQPAAPTTLACVAPGPDGSPGYSFYSGATAERMLTEADLARLPEHIDALHVGSYCMVVEPVATTQRMLVQRQHGRSLVAYDPNVRLGIEPDVAKWRATLEWMSSRAQLIKISEEDLECLYPGRAPTAFMEAMLLAGVALVVVTRGARGVLARSSSGVELDLPAHAVTVVDTVGAGDSFQAALICWLVGHGISGPGSAAALQALDQRTLRGALEFAGGAAAITCGRRGADLPRRDELAVPKE